MTTNPQLLSTNVIWQAIPGTSQEIAIDTRADHTLYHGTRGPGKTITQLMRFHRRVGLGYGEFWRGVIFDREFKNLADIVAQSKRFFKRFNNGAKFLTSHSEYKWVWPSGEELLFRHVKASEDYDDYHGHEYPFIGWNELTKQPTAELYDKMMSTNRSSFIPEFDTPKNPDGTYRTPDGRPLPNIPLEVFSTTNPSGPGHNWVKRRFITPAPNGVLVKREVEIFNPQTQRDEKYIVTQVAIFGSYRENKYLDPKYVAELNILTASNPNLKAAWLYGDWNVVSGGAFDDVFDINIHRIARFPVPSGWRIDRSFDWGSTHPFSVCWWCEANGEEITLPNGEIFCPTPGSLIQIAEWYGTNELGSNKGLQLSAKDVAQGIIKREISLMENGWILEQPRPGPADNQISDVREKDVDTIEKKMADEGICWTRSDKSPGSRINGLQLMRDRFQAAATGEGAALYYMANCEASLDTIPILPRDPDKPDDVDTTAEDHPYDANRYRVLKGSNRIAESFEIRFAQ